MSKIKQTIKFGGLNNQQSPEEVGIDDLVIAANIDLMNDSSFRRRTGKTLTSITGVNYHSGWANVDQDIAMLMDGTNLIQLDASLGQTAIGAMPSTEYVNFAESTDLIACLSASYLRFVVGGAFISFTLPTPLNGEPQNKVLATNWGGGNCVAFFAGQMLVGVDDGILFSDPVSAGWYDERDYKLPTGFSVQHIAPVDDGVWVCGAKHIAFLPGDTAVGFRYIDVIDIGVSTIALARRSEWKGKETVAPVWGALTDTGVVLLSNSGSIEDISGDGYRPSIGSAQSSIVRDINGSKQFLASFTYSSDPHLYKDKSMTVDTEEG